MWGEIYNNKKGKIKGPKCVRAKIRRELIV